MIRVVLDTNVLVSAIWSKDGTPAKVVHLIPDRKIIPCFCDEILYEYEIVLLRSKFNFPQYQITALLENIKRLGVSCAVSRSDTNMSDESDRIFYDVARESKAILITGNTKHFPPEPFIMTPTEFMQKCNM